MVQRRWCFRSTFSCVYFVHSLFRSHSGLFCFRYFFFFFLLYFWLYLFSSLSFVDVRDVCVVQECFKLSKLFVSFRVLLFRFFLFVFFFLWFLYIIFCFYDVVHSLWTFAQSSLVRTRDEAFYRFVLMRVDLPRWVTVDLTVNRQVPWKSNIHFIRKNIWKI